MRFCDFFISYKIGLKDIPNIIPFTKSPRSRKIAAITIFAACILDVIFFLFNKTIASIITFGFMLLCLLIFFIINSTKSNLETMLNDHYTPYSAARINMTINVLNNYGIKSSDISSIDLLISEAQSAQLNSNFLLPLEKPFKILRAIIVPVVVFVVQKIGNNATQYQLITMAVQLITISILIFSLIVSISPILKAIFYPDYNKYDALIYDLRQIKIFHSRDTITPTPTIKQAV